MAITVLTGIATHEALSYAVVSVSSSPTMSLAANVFRGSRSAKYGVIVCSSSAGSNAPCPETNRCSTVGGASSATISCEPDARETELLGYRRRGVRRMLEEMAAVVR